MVALPAAGSTVIARWPVEVIFSRTPITKLLPLIVSVLPEPTLPATVATDGISVSAAPRPAGLRLICASVPLTPGASPAPPSARTDTPAVASPNVTIPLGHTSTSGTPGLSNTFGFAWMVMGPALPPARAEPTPALPPPALTLP